ncbi:MAG: PhzF family phenazine biosynthesis protein [Sphingomicrobium sp.]
MAAFDFLTLDVFTDRPFGGNPLAIVTDGRELDDAAMQAIATEFNLSETVFFLPPTAGSDAIATVRIFTPVNELPFAGHPNVGAAFYVATNGGLFGKDCGDRFTFEEKAGPVECFVERAGGKVQTAITAPRPLSVGQEIDVDTVAACASLDAGSVATAVHRPVMASVGLPFVTAELVSLDALARAKPVANAFVEANTHYRPVDDFFSLYLYVRDPDDPSQIRTRMFSPLSNIPEDPATGSAAAALAAFVATFDGADTERRYFIVQGVEMGRRSEITATVNDGRVRIGGPCVPMQRGTLTI